MPPTDIKSPARQLLLTGPHNYGQLKRVKLYVPIRTEAQILRGLQRFWASCKEFGKDFAGAVQTTDHGFYLFISFNC